MVDDLDPATPPQDSGPPDAVETDGAALGSAEDFDEDRLRVDPLESGMDPPEHWSGADKYGTTPYEQSHPRPLSHRLTDEEPDVQPDQPPASLSTVPGDEVSQTVDGMTITREPGAVEGEAIGPEDDLDAKARSEAMRRGQLADDAGGSMASTVRTPPPAP